MNSRKYYLMISIVLILVEILIETQCSGGFIRYYLGDYLLVIGLYTIVKTIKPSCNAIKLSVSILVFSFGVEFLQGIHILKLLGIQQTRLTDIIIGSSFCIYDLVCYTLGVITVYFVDQFYTNRVLK